ncbi:MAG TPA: tautomerase family protein [Thermoanaerobaculia bacterium]|nr:tautomerase family protein [Thermoanaerobaculia bacterium]
MPFVKVFLREGKDEQYLSGLSRAIQEALVAEANVPADDQFQVLIELPATRLIAHPSYGNVARGNDLVIIEITLNAGRSVEIKKNLYQAIVRNLAFSSGVRPDDVLISLLEVTKENWSFGNGIATYT